jgi:hypothetical protein
VAGSGPRGVRGRAEAVRARARFDHAQLTQVGQQRVQRARRAQVRPTISADALPLKQRLRSASNCRCLSVAEAK